MTQKGQLYIGRDIYTVDDMAPTVEAVSEKDGKIIAAGSESEYRARLGDSYESIDLKGWTMLPGFIDTHLHPPLTVFLSSLLICDIYPPFGNFKPD